MLEPKPKRSSFTRLKFIELSCIFFDKCGKLRKEPVGPGETPLLAELRLRNELKEAGWVLGEHPDYPDELYDICPDCAKSVPCPEKQGD